MAFHEPWHSLDGAGACPILNSMNQAEKQRMPSPSLHQIFIQPSLSICGRKARSLECPLPPLLATAFPGARGRGGGICHSCHALSRSLLPEFAHQRVRYCCLRCLFIGVPPPLLFSKHANLGGAFSDCHILFILRSSNQPATR